MSDSIYEINKNLIDQFGRDLSSGLPNFRLVKTTGQTEKRYLEHNVFSSDGNIYLRTDKGVEEVPKYEAIFDDMWVLEHIEPTIGNPYLECVTKLS